MVEGEKKYRIMKEVINNSVKNSFHFNNNFSSVSKEGSFTNPKDYM